MVDRRRNGTNGKEEGRKCNLRTFLLEIIMIFAAASVKTYSQTDYWHLVDSPNFSSATSIAINPQGYVFVGTFAGQILLSKDDGNTWSLVGDSGFANTGVQSLIVDQKGNLVVGTGAGIFVSMDDGYHWVQANSGLNSSYEVVYALAVDSSYILASTGGGLFRSSNEGESWSEVYGGFSYGFPGHIVNCVTASPVGYLYAGTTDGVYRSSDHGNSWSQTDAGFSPTNPLIYSLAVDSSGNVFAGINGAVYESTNNGSNWTQVFTTAGSYVEQLAVAPDGEVFAGTSKTIYKSTDKGASWVNTPVPIDTSILVYSLAFSANGDVFAGTRFNGVFVSTDSGATWTQVNTGMQDGISAIAGGPNGYIFAGCPEGHYANPIFRSTDFGASWTETAVNISGLYGSYNTHVSSLVADQRGDVFAATWANGLLRSTDNGKTWNRSAGLKVNGVISLAIDSTGVVYAGTDSGVFESTDAGSTWLFTGLEGYQILSLTVDSARDLFAGAGNLTEPAVPSGIFRLSHNSGSWTRVDSLYETNVKSIVINSKGYIFAAASPQPSGISGVLRSEDNGATWSPVDSGLINSTYYNYAASLAIDSSGAIFAAVGPYYGVFRSTDYGQTWEQADSGLNSDDLDITSLASNSNGIIFAGSGLGRIYEYISGGSLTSVKKSVYSRPSGFLLGQNYPNPFNPTTVITYQLSAVSQVTLRVYDVLGREVATLVNEKENAGSYSVTFDASRLASGVYFYKLVAVGNNGERFVSVKKLALLK